MRYRPSRGLGAEPARFLAQAGAPGQWPPGPPQDVGQEETGDADRGIPIGPPPPPPPGSFSPGNPYAGGTSREEFAAAIEWEKRFGNLRAQQEPREPRQYAPRPPLEGERAEAELRQTNARIAQIEQEIGLAREQASQAAQTQNAQVALAQLQYARGLENDLNNLQLSRERLSFERELGYAGSQRQDLQANLQRAQATGYYGGAPTMERELALSASDRANLASMAQVAETAATIALRMGDQAEAQRQFDKAQLLRERAQGFGEEMGRGQLGLGQRAQTLSEELGRGQFGLQERSQALSEELGRGRLGLEQAQFQFARERSPASAISRTFGLRGMQPPATLPPGAPGSATGGLDTTMRPLSQGEIMSSPYTAPGVRYGLGGIKPPRVQLPLAAISGQRLQGLLPSERSELSATVEAAGVNPEDYFEHSRRLTEVTPPALQRRVLRRPAQAAGVY